MCAEAAHLPARAPRLDLVPAMAHAARMSAAESACPAHYREDLREPRLGRERLADAEKVRGGSRLLGLRQAPSGLA